jgi:hypothetical protein
MGWRGGGRERNRDGDKNTNDAAQFSTNIFVSIKLSDRLIVAVIFRVAISI